MALVRAKLSIRLEQDARHGCNIDTWPVREDSAYEADRVWFRHKETLKDQNYYITLPTIYGKIGDEEVMEPVKWEAKLRNAVVQVFFELTSKYIKGSGSSFTPKITHMVVLKAPFDPPKLGSSSKRVGSSSLPTSPQKKQRTN